MNKIREEERDMMVMKLIRAGVPSATARQTPIEVRVDESSKILCQTFTIDGKKVQLEGKFDLVEGSKPIPRVFEILISS